MAPRRNARAKKLVFRYNKLRQEYDHRMCSRISRLKNLFRLLNSGNHAPSPMSEMSALSSVSSFEGDEMSGDSSDFSSDVSDDVWGEILGHNWRGKTMLGSDTSITSGPFATSLSDLPELILVGRHSSSSSGYGDDEDSDFASDMLEISDEDGDGDTGIMGGSEDSEEGYSGGVLDPGDRWARLRQWVHQQIDQMYANRYEVPRDELPRGPSTMRHVLMTLKSARPDKFREELRVTPLTFDAIVAAIAPDPVFQNNSNNAQTPVEEQLAITLYRFGHDGNAASLQSIANWAGCGKGTVSLITRRVMVAILRVEFMDEAVRFPTAEEKEAAKKWVHKHSCKAWRDGWCFVNGTLVPLSERPHWFGESYFDRKNRYSLNIQACCTIYLTQD